MPPHLHTPPLPRTAKATIGDHAQAQPPPPHSPFPPTRQLDYLRAHPKLYWTLASFTAASALGQAFIFFVIREFGSLVNTQVTTLRKLFTIVYGEIFSAKKDGVNMEQWFCVVLVFVGVWIGEQDKEKDKGAKEAKEAKEGKAVGT